MTTMNLPPGSRFRPSDVTLVRLLTKMVNKNKSGFITTLNVYMDDPDDLDHVRNHTLFKKNEWYYFVPRNKRGVKTQTVRTVPGREKTKGGTWKSTGKKTEIFDEGNKKVVGYKQSLVYYRKVQGKTDWLMTEYSLHKDTHDNLVLCWIRDKTKEDKHQVVTHGQPILSLHAPENMMLYNTNRVQDNVGVADTTNMRMPEGEHVIATHGQPSNTTILPPPPMEGNGNTYYDSSGTEDMNLYLPPPENNGNMYYNGFDGADNMMLNNMAYPLLDELVYDDNEMFDIDELLGNCGEGEEKVKETVLAMLEQRGTSSY